MASKFTESPIIWNHAGVKKPGAFTLQMKTRLKKMSCSVVTKLMSPGFLRHVQLNVLTRHIGTGHIMSIISPLSLNCLNSLKTVAVKLMAREVGGAQSQ